ncbi:MAG: YigZ family protein [Bacteroidia bacterium]
MLFEDTYRTLKAPAEGIFRDRGSKFIGYAFPVKTEAAFKEELARIRKEHFDARHHCYALRLGADKLFFRANDDGEPSGTAGRPILGQIQSADLTDTGIIVVRYFGGTLLGVSGLINAYRAAAADALAHAEIIEKQVTEIYRISFPYSLMNDVMKFLKDKNLPQWNQDFQLECSLEFAVRKSEADAVLEKLSALEGLKKEYLRTE